jgi:hypothetical protein
MADPMMEGVEAIGFQPIEAHESLRQFDPELIRLWDQYTQASEYDRQFKKDWSRFYLIVSGVHWDGRQAEWMATPVINLTTGFINTVTSIMTDSRPQIAVIPRQPEQDHIAGVLSSVVEYLWEANDLDVKLPKTVKNSLIFGNSFLKVMWDQTLRRGEGDIKVCEVDPSHVFISPFARSLDDADYVIHAENLPRGLVDRMYPGQLEDVQDGPKDDTLTLKRNVTSQMGQGGNDEGVTNVQTTDGSTVWSYRGGTKESGANDGRSDLVTVLERWERGQDGSVTQTVAINDKILPGFPRPSPFQHSRFPFVHFVDNPNTWSAWATGEVQDVERLQIEINKRRGHILDILRYTANPMLVVDPASGIDYEKLVARPGLVITAEGGLSSVGWLNGANVPNALFEVNNMDKADFDSVLGNVEVIQGRRPEGVEAGVAIELLQEAANVRMRLKVRYMENSLRKLGELLVAMVQQFYTTERVFRLSGGEMLQLEKPLTQEMRQQFVAINQVQEVNPETGDPTQVENQIPPVAEAEFDVRIGAGSTLPVSRAVNFQKAITMYSMQLADDVAVWKASGFPRWQEELQRSRMFWQAQMMQQAQMQATGGIGQPGTQAGQEQAAPSDEDLDVAMAGEAAEEPQPEE